MRKNHSLADKLFRAVCLSFSALLLLLSLLCNIGIMWTEARIAELCQGIDTAKRDAEILSVRIENRIGLSELEERAAQQLGMHRPGTEQIFFLPLD